MANLGQAFLVYYQPAGFYDSGLLASAISFAIDLSKIVQVRSSSLIGTPALFRRRVQTLMKMTGSDV